MDDQDHRAGAFVALDRSLYGGIDAFEPLLV
jgi:hypothetical protein